MSQRLADKVAVVTGASSGFGRAIAVAFAAQGAKIVVGDLQPEPSKGGFEAEPNSTTVEEIEEGGGAATFVRCDVTKQADVANLVQEAVKQFLKQGTGGNIVNLVSTAGLQGHPNQSVYNISKGGQANLTRCMAIEYGQNGIRVNGICPTYAKTALTRALFDDKGFDDFFTQSIPLKRWGEAADIANLAVFLASDESSYIHGDLVRIDGGETLCRYSV